MPGRPGLRYERSVTPFVLRTDRLTLRQLVPDDAQAMFDLNADPEVRRFVPDAPQASVDAERRALEDYQAVYRDHGFARWATIETSSGEWLGWCGLRRQPDGEVDLGYRFRRATWGRGFATEAARASLAYGFDTLGLARIVAVVQAGNATSIRVLEKLGLRREQPTTFGHAPAFLWAVTGDAWRATSPDRAGRG
jgi:ribosomal-protein-alanine N-acetyltransferase